LETGRLRRRRCAGCLRDIGMSLPLDSDIVVFSHPRPRLLIDAPLY
jgi:hypothetical protein